MTPVTQTAMPTGPDPMIPSPLRRRPRRLAAVALALGLLALPAHAKCLMPKNAGQLQAEVVAAVNAQRRAAGLGALTLSEPLGRIAQSHACDIAARKTTSHSSANGATITDRLRAVGYRFGAAAENTGRGPATADAVVAMWMNSPAHRANILNARLRELAVGIAVSAAPESRFHWVLNMGARR